MPQAPSDDYYALLGVDHHADDEDIRRAWRQLALAWHPDRAGPEATATFQRISVAYAVISDPSARAAYDRRRGTPKRPAPPPPPAEEQPRRAPGVLLTHLSRNLDILLAMGTARRAEDGVIELFLEEEDRATGGMVTIAMRVTVHCSACLGSANAPCAVCGGARTVEDQFAAWLAIRPGVADGTILTPSAQLPGVVAPVRFRVRFA